MRVLLAVVACLALVSVAVPVAAAPLDDDISVASEVPVTPMDSRVKMASNSPILAQDPNEPRFVALASRRDAPDYGCSLHVSGDGGRYWVPARAVSKLPSGAEKCYAPEIAFDAKGTLYFLFVGLAGLGNSPRGTYLTTSADRGHTFSTPRLIQGPGGAEILGPHNYMVRMAIDPELGERGRIHLVWVRAVSAPSTGGLPPQGNPIMAAHSDDGGRTFSGPVQVSDVDRARVVAPAVTIGDDHAVHVAYYDLHSDILDYQGLEGSTWDGEWSLVVATSTDRGRRFGKGVVVNRRIAPPGRVMLIFTMPAPALAAHGPHLYAAWPDARHGDPDILFSRSTDDGQSWSKPQRLNDDPLGNGIHQSLPRLSVAPTGRVDAVFYDRRDDPTNAANHVYFSFSSDSGRRFSPNLRLTSRHSDSRIGPTYPSIASAEGQVDFGSRLGLLSRPSAAVAAWADTRNGTIDQHQAIFSTQVTLPKGGGVLGRVRALRGLVFASAIAGIAVAVLLARRRFLRRAAEVPGDAEQASRGEE